ncbi:hypothetical protein [Dechloromonas sp.]|uniref:hypothetical protein n=1 Tax=Dechloromonas sp. TaxID=1917218 RepID=UPI00120402E4|nr:hypothetical protein [Dechloromonas sp.]MBU3695791.1 hypothetical protein [Dechloromonas sp.]TEX48170.1 MAG: hypothetical protein CFR70_07980 [Rhodocyclaceae bacterium]
MSVLLFAISAMRAIVEMLLLCLMGQGVLALLAGNKRDGNPVYRLFSLITQGPRAIVARLLPDGTRKSTITMLTGTSLLFLWITLAILRKSV